MSRPREKGGSVDSTDLTGAPLGTPCRVLTEVPNTVLLPDAYRLVAETQVGRVILLKCHKCSEESVPGVLWEQKGFGQQGKLVRKGSRGRLCLHY